jgi:glycosyltransferase involved in cell wall biosynthesis
MSEPPERPPIAQAPISVVLPARNEEPRLEKTLTGWAEQLDGRESDYELLLVDDGSGDRTASLAEALAARHPRLRVFRHDKPLGFGAALRTGLAAARHPLFCYCTCDGQFTPADLKLLLGEVDKVDLVSACRLPPTLLNRWFGNEPAMRLLRRFTFGLHMLDATCPFKLFRRSIFDRIPLQSSGPFVHTEILAKANFLGCLMTEVTVPVQPAAGTPSPLLQASRGERWAEAYQVFKHPDFGPAVLPS